MQRSSFVGIAPEWIAVPVCLAGLSAVAAGFLTFAPAEPALAHGVEGPLLLLALAVAAEHVPFPVATGRKISVAFVFLLAAAVLYGAAVAVVMGALTIALNSQSYFPRKPRIRVLFNASSTALAAGAAGLAAKAVGGHAFLVPAVIAAAAAFLGINLLTVAAVLSRAERRGFVELVITTLRGVAVPFVMAVSIVPLFVLGWGSSKLIALSVVFPVAGIGLYLRSLDDSRQALALALTDPLTGLGNRRHFDERLRRELDRSETGAGPVSLIIIDLNRLKLVNDRFGHEAGDRLLCQVASCLRQSGESFRFGGDEFAILLAGAGDAQAALILEAVRERVQSVETVGGQSAVAALGLATYPSAGLSRDTFLRAADERAYREKRGVGST